MLEAAKRAGRNPRYIITDRLNVYPDGIDAAFGSGTSHIQSGGLESDTNNNLIERFHGTLKARTKVLRGLKSVQTATDFTDAWLVYYNYLRGDRADPADGVLGGARRVRRGL
jgi:transposase-like protein